MDERIVAFERVDICQGVRIDIMVVLVSTIYMYVKHMLQNMVVQMHGNLSLYKLRSHIVQKIVTL